MPQRMKSKKAYVLTALYDAVVAGGRRKQEGGSDYVHDLQI